MAQQDVDNNLKTPPRRIVGTPQQRSSTRSKKEGEEDDDLPTSLLQAPRRNMLGEGKHRVNNTPVARRQLEFPDLPPPAIPSTNGRGYSLKRKRSSEQQQEVDGCAFRPIGDNSDENYRSSDGDEPP
eukprot:scaffold4099_cov98-Cylindrotheca_fusiformis.AAC.5